MTKVILLISVSRDGFTTASDIRATSAHAYHLLKLRHVVLNTLTRRLLGSQPAECEFRP